MRHRLTGSDEGGASLSFHFYQLPNFDIDWQVTARLADCTRLRVPCILTEFDLQIVSPWEPGYNAAALNHILDTVDAAGVSWVGWEYADMWYGNGSLVPKTATILSRPFAPLVAGVLQHAAFDVNASVYTLLYTLDAALTEPTVVFVNVDLHYPAGFAVSLTGPVSYTIQWHNATSADDTDWEVASGAPLPPAPFAFAYVLVTPASSPAPSANVTVTVSPA